MFFNENWFACSISCIIMPRSLESRLGSAQYIHIKSKVGFCFSISCAAIYKPVFKSRRCCNSLQKFALVFAAQEEESQLNILCVSRLCYQCKFFSCICYTGNRIAVEEQLEFQFLGMLQFTFWAFPQHILLHFPNNLLHFPIKIASFTQKNAAFSQQFTAFPQQIASFPQQFDAFPHAMLCHFAKKERTQFTKYCQFVPYLGLNFV